MEELIQATGLSEKKARALMAAAREMTAPKEEEAAVETAAGPASAE